MTYEEMANLIRDPVFGSRVKVACLKFADNILIGSGQHSNGLIRWATQTFQQPDMVAQGIQGPTVMDAAVQESGKDVTDQALQGAVEAAVKKTM